MNPSLAVLLADGAEPLEVAAPVDALRRGGVRVACVAVGGARTVELAQDVRMDADSLLVETHLPDFDGLLIPGGSVGVDNLLSSSAVLEAVASFAREGRFVAAICAGPMVLNAAGILEGRRVTCYPGCEAGFPTEAYTGTLGVVRDENLVTASGPAFALEFGLTCLAALTTQENANEVAADMLAQRKPS